MKKRKHIQQVQHIQPASRQVYPVAHARMDNTLTNLLSNVSSARAKANSTTFTTRIITDTELLSMFNYDWMSRKIINIPIGDALKGWRKIEIPSTDGEQIRLIEKEEKRVKLQSKICEAMTLADILGTSLILLNVAGDVDTSLEITPLTTGQADFQSLHVFAKGFFKPEGDEVISDVLSPRFGQPVYFKIGEQIFHNSRCIIVKGAYNPPSTSSTLKPWEGVSKLLPLYGSIINSQTFNDVVVSLAHECKVDIVSIEDLFLRLANTQETAALQERFSLSMLSKSLNNTLLLDKNETFQTRQVNFSGFNDLIKTLTLMVAGASDIPATRFIGQSAVGMGATGDGDSRNYYDMIEVKRDSQLIPIIDDIDLYMVPSVLGSMPPDYSYTMTPLWQPSENEQADVDKKRAETAAIYLDKEVITPSMVAAELQENGTYSSITDEYIEALATLEMQADDSEPTGEPVNEG